IGNNYRRVFTLDEIHRVLDFLYQKTGQEVYRRSRNPGEKLQVIATANFKGGAAKTTTAVHLGQWLALRGYRALLVDLDNQASLTSLFGLQPAVDIARDATLYPVFTGAHSDLRACIRQTYWPRLDLVPANLHLGGVDFELPVKMAQDPSF